ncbi:hypothetical protein VFPBJ_00900 [Purpureocillium lilacinum]|uniref:Uncharacterized protein n=1 Tax=Purpureocillium lilacinum TaxID=33203 RepID=A0A179HBD7_PURLI|nr:hypothetical protein VFPBJ_00900 [Purpureocillium lilacinum]
MAHSHEHGAQLAAVTQAAWPGRPQPQSPHDPGPLIRPEVSRLDIPTPRNRAWGACTGTCVLRMANLLPLIKVPKDRHGDGPVPRRAGTIRPVHSHRHLQSSHLTNREIWAQDKKRQRTTNRRTGRKGAQNTKKTMPGEREKSRSCIVPRDGTHARLRGKTTMSSTSGPNIVFAGFWGAVTTGPVSSPQTETRVGQGRRRKGEARAF